MSEETFSSLTLRLLTKLLMFTSGPINCELFCGDWGRIFLESRWNLQKQRNSVLTWTAWGVYGFMGLCEFVSLSALLRACCPFIQITNEDIKQAEACTDPWPTPQVTGFWLALPFGFGHSRVFNPHHLSSSHPVASSASPWECYGRQYWTPFWRKSKQNPLLSLPKREKGLSENLCLSLWGKQIHQISWFMVCN